MTEGFDWHRYFYDENYNPAICGFKRLFMWVMLNVPDCSHITGLPRYFINFCVIVATVGFVGQAWISSTSPLELFLRIYLASWIPAIFFMKILAASLYWGMLKYCGFAYAIFNRDKGVEKACEQLQRNI